MINIDRNNYEEYFIDYLDGKLSHSDKKIMMLFLEQNPDLREELEMFDEEVLVADEIIYTNKDDLRRNNSLTSNITNYDELYIADLEGDLSKKEKELFQEFITENPERQLAYRLYQATKVKPDDAIVYPNKSLLKRKGKTFLGGRYAIISAAASVMVLLAIYLFVPQKKENINNKLVAESSEFLKNDSKPENAGQINVTNKTEKIEPINSTKIAINNLSNKVEVKGKLAINHVNSVNSEEDKNRSIQIDQLAPKKVAYNFSTSNNEPLLAKVSMYRISVQEEPTENYHTIKSLLAMTFNKKVLDKENKDKIELFDIAQAGVKGINKLTGSNMKLERKMDENGNLAKTEFNSRLIAFSAPVKKK